VAWDGCGPNGNGGTGAVCAWRLPLDATCDDGDSLHFHFSPFVAKNTAVKASKDGYMKGTD
jgi:hypothetical protein